MQGLNCGRAAKGHLDFNFDLRVPSSVSGLFLRFNAALRGNGRGKIDHILAI